MTLVTHPNFMKFELFFAVLAMFNDQVSFVCLLLEK